MNRLFLCIIFLSQLGTLSSFARAEDIVKSLKYVGEGNVLTAYDVATSEIVWKTHLPDRRDKAANITEIGKHLITSYWFNIYLIDNSSGRILDTVNSFCFVNHKAMVQVDGERFVLRSNCANGETGESWVDYYQYRISDETLLKEGHVTNP